MSVTKSLSRVEIKDADRGEFDAVFATLNVVDHDKDVTPPGAFDDGAKVAVSAWGHQSWGGKLPVGVATIRETRTEAVASGQFFMDVPEAAATFQTVKRLHAAGLGEWSYGYDVLEHSFGDFGGQHVRFLKRLAVHEISPLLQGAGVNTRTLSAKGAKPATVATGGSAVEYKAAIRPHETAVVSKAWDAATVVAGLADDTSVSDLRSVYAWVDSNGDPETKSSYRFPHHQGPGGPANVRACLAGIAALNGARGGTSIPDADRQGVYNHLAGHLRDDDREPPVLKSADPGGLKFNEEAMVVMADLSGLLDRACEVLALRATKGKGLAPASVELLDWLRDDMRRLQSLLDSPEDEAAREFVRFVALQNRS